MKPEAVKYALGELTLSDIWSLSKDIVQIDVATKRISGIASGMFFSSLMELAVKNVEETTAHLNLLCKKKLGANSCNFPTDKRIAFDWNQKVKLEKTNSILIRSSSYGGYVYDWTVTFKSSFGILEELKGVSK